MVRRSFLKMLMALPLVKFLLKGKPDPILANAQEKPEEPTKPQYAYVQFITEASDESTTVRCYAYDANMNCMREMPIIGVREYQGHWVFDIDLT